MSMKCKCGGEIDLTTGKCKSCKTQNIKMSGNASIKITEINGNKTKVVSRNKNKPGDYGSIIELK